MGKTQQRKALRQVARSGLDKAETEYYNKRLRAIKEEEDARRNALEANPARGMTKREFYLYEIDDMVRKAVKEGCEYGCLKTEFETERRLVITMVTVLNRFFHVGKKRMNQFMAEFVEEQNFTIDDLDAEDKLAALNEKLGMNLHFDKPQELKDMEMAMWKEGYM